MSRDGERHTAELARLEARRKELDDALGRLARDEAEADEVAELAQLVERMEQEVEAARAKASMEKNNMTDVKKAARLNREAAERQLDKLAETMRTEGETFEKAYSRALDTDMGRSLMAARDDAQELERHGPTSMHLADARKNLMEG